MKKLIVNENCIGCGLCFSTDEEHFRCNDQGLSEVISNENLNSDTLKTAMNSCPVNAIKIVNTDEESDSNHCECDNDDKCHCEHCHCEK